MNKPMMLHVQTRLSAGGKCQKWCKKKCADKDGVFSASLGAAGECWCNCNDDSTYIKNIGYTLPF